jgi:amidase
MPFQAPGVPELKQVAAQLKFEMSDADLEDFRTLLADACRAYEAIDAMPDYLPEVKYPRQAGHRPKPAENALGAWYWKTRVEGSGTGLLSGRTVALKDNICLAGIPMSSGTSILEGFVPQVDATVVTRVLDAGGVITGKAVCENFCTSGGSHTSATGPVQNPLKSGHTSGGSSSGCAALVAARAVDMSIGGDQGGSIRLPSSFCGTYGMKPTHGLVPYTGIMSMETTIDHAGPITANVHDNALLLEVIAGPDGIDGRQKNFPKESYTSSLGKNISGLRIALVKEGFGGPTAQVAVDEKVRAAAGILQKRGAQIEEVSIPFHPAGAALFIPHASEGIVRQMMLDYGFGQNQEGLALLDLRDASAAWRARTNELPETLKMFMLAGQYGLSRYGGRYYAKCANLRRKLRAAYDEALKQHDLLLMPTTPMVAPALPGRNPSRGEMIQKALEMLANTPQFDLTGHPAMSVPCGMSEGLPVGMMLVGRHYAEATIYQAAAAFESAVDWKLS